MPIVRRSVKQIRKHAGRVDWKRVRRTTDREIAAQIATDPDTAPTWQRRVICGAYTTRPFRM